MFTKFKLLLQRFLNSRVSEYTIHYIGASHVFLAIDPKLNTKGEIDIRNLKNAVVVDTRYLLENHEEIVRQLKTAYPEA